MREYNDLREYWNRVSQIYYWPQSYILIGPKGMYRPKSLRVRQSELLWGGKKKAVEQPKVLIIKTALCFSPQMIFHNYTKMHRNSNRILAASIISCRLAQSRINSVLPPLPLFPLSEALESTMFNYFLKELSKHFRNKWLTNDFKFMYCLCKRKLINQKR